jgi:thioredoxin reductase (NADPH)
MTSTKLLIIGSGPAGLTAAIYAARASLAPIVLEGPEPGGQLMWTTEVENFPGFAKGIMGPELMSTMREQAKHFGAELRTESAVKIDFSSRPYKIATDKDEISAESVIIATGASAMWLNLPNEQRLRGKGVSACATCDGFFFKGKEIAVVGGGDSAMEEANFLTKFATKVHVLVRTEKLRASDIMAKRAQANEKIEFHYNVQVSDVLGEASVTGVQLTATDGSVSELPVQGLFLAIGHKPNTDIFKEQLPLDKKGYLVIHDQVKSDKEGVFIAGDVSDFRYRQAITAAGWGCMAALEAERFLHGA